MISQSLNIAQLPNLGPLGAVSPGDFKELTLPIALESRQCCQFLLADEVKAIYGVEIDVTVESRGPALGPTVLRLIAGETNFTEIELLSSGNYQVYGDVTLGHEKSLIVGLVDVWPQPRSSTRVRINSVRVSLTPLKFQALSDWIQVGFVDGRRQMSLNSILGSVDPLGVVVEDSTSFQRYLRRDKIDGFQLLTESGHLDELLHRGLVSPFALETTTSLKFPWRLQTPKGLPANFLAATQLITIIQKWLSIDQYLTAIEPNAYCMIDFNVSNFVEIHSNDWRLVDFGSIQPIPNVWTGMESLVRHGLPLLHLRQDHPGTQLTDLNHVWNFAPVKDEQVCRDSPLKSVLDWLGMEDPELLSTEDRRSFARTVESMIQDVDSSPSRSFWSNYDGSIHKYLDEYRVPLPLIQLKLSRDDTVASILQSIGSGSLIDLGSAGGRFSAIALRLGFEVLAIDGDDLHVEQILATAREESNLPLSARSVRLREGSLKPFLSLYRADVVLCLALTHHLLLANYSPVKSSPIPISLLCEFLGLLSDKTLLVEFMPLGLASAATNFKPHPSPLPTDYSCDNFVDHLLNHFTKVNVVEYQEDHTHRQLLVCEK